MLRTTFQRTTLNKVLAKLSPEDFALLGPHLKPVDLPVHMQLEDHNELISHVYFIERGIVSVVANGLGKRQIEVGIIGCEGLTGLAVIMGETHAAHRSFVQIAGAGLQLKTARLRLAIDKSRTLHGALLRYGHEFVTQTARTALANGRSKIEERLARWLLMAHDRVDGDEMLLTHDFLSTMLGVRRAGVTQALHILQSAELIRSYRGNITILDRAGLEASADGTYRP